ncbi:MAG: radical SAM protein, partial [Planctomycetota bacterium]
LDNLDSLPFLDFSSIDISCYKPILPLLASRGCIRKCVFCSEWNLYKKFRQHSVRYAIAQITYLLQRYNITYFSFHDSLINGNLEWLEKFCQEIINKNISIQWEAQIAIRSEMDTALFTLMKKAGCINLFIGLESASDKILAQMNKGFTINDAQRIFSELTKAGLMFEVSIIVGYPGESQQDFKHTLDFLKTHKRIIPKIAQVSGFTLYPQSVLYGQRLSLTEEPVITKRLKKIEKFLEKNKIKHKKAFIDNLRYDHANKYN